MIAATIKSTVRPVRTLLLVAAVATLVVACDNDDDDDMASDNGGEDPVMMMGTAALSAVSSQAADSQPIDDGLDQVEADLLTQFGSPDSTPFPVGDADTVESLLTQ